MPSVRPPRRPLNSSRWRKRGSATRSRSAGVHDRWYDVAGHAGAAAVCGRCVVAGHHAGARAPQDRRRAASIRQRAPALTVCLWDAASTGVPLPDRPWGTDDNLSRGDIRDFADPNIRTAYTMGPNALSMLDERRNLALFCTTSAAHIPTDYRGSPLLVILSWWTSMQGLQYVHAGAVGTPEGGVLLVGKGGSGQVDIARCRVSARTCSTRRMITVWSMRARTYRSCTASTARRSSCPITRAIFRTSCRTSATRNTSPPSRR